MAEGAFGRRLVDVEQEQTHVLLAEDLDELDAPGDVESLLVVRAAQELLPESKAAAEIKALFESLNIPTRPHPHKLTSEPVRELRP